LPCSMRSTVAVVAADFVADTLIVIGITIAVGAVAFALREAWQALTRAGRQLGPAVPRIAGERQCMGGCARK
jgi:hypothetical protein